MCCSTDYIVFPVKCKSVYIILQFAESLPARQEFCWFCVNNTIEDIASAGDNAIYLEEGWKMRKVYIMQQVWRFLFCFVLLFAGSAIAQADSLTPSTRCEGYMHYTNSRFGYSIDVPNSYALIFKPDNADGAIFKDNNFNRTIRVYATYFNTAYEDQLKNLHGKVTYSDLQEDFYVISWLDQGTIYYKKVYFTKEESAGFILEYPINDKEVMDEVVSHIAETLIPRWKK